MIHLKEVVYVSIVSMLFQSITNTQTGIISQFTQQNGNSWAGPLSIAMIFFGSGFGSLRNSYIGKYLYRSIMVVGAYGWIVFIGFSIVFLYVGFSALVIVIIMVGCLCCGFLVSIYYNCLFNYVNQCSIRDKVESKYFGINMGLTQASNIIGSVLSTLLIVPLGQKLYSFVMLGLLILISCLFCGVKEFKPQDEMNYNVLHQDKTQKEEINPNIQNQQIEERKEGQDQPQKIPYILFFCFSFSGIMVSFVYSQLSIIFYKTFDDMQDQQLNRITFINFIIEGVGELIGGLIVVFGSKYIQNLIKWYMANGVLFLVGVTMIYLGSYLKILEIIEAASVLVGIADCLGFSIGLAIAGKFQQNGVSLFNFGQSFTVAVLTVTNAFVDLQYMMIIYLIIFGLNGYALFKERTIILGDPIVKEDKSEI